MPGYIQDQRLSLSLQKYELPAEPNMSFLQSLVRTKRVEDVIRQGDDEPGGDHHARLSKRLSAFDLMGFGIGIVIGTGIFTLTGVQAKIGRAQSELQSR